MNILNLIEKNKKIIIIVVIVLLVICIFTNCYKENFENNDKSKDDDSSKILCCPKTLPYYLATDGQGGKKKCMQYNNSNNLNVKWDDKITGNISLNTSVSSTDCGKNPNLVFAGGACKLRQNAWGMPSKKDSCSDKQVEVQ
jgi:hypothetical protein